MALIHEKMIAAAREMPSIGKDRDNRQQGYKFRGIDDVYLVAGPVLAKNGICVTAEILEEHRDERQSKSGGVLMCCVLRVRYHFTAEDGTAVHSDAVGEGMDSGDKASAKAMSIAQKYAILQAFMIPTEDPKDPENDNPEPAPKPHPAGPEFEPKAKTKAAKPAKERTPEEAALAERYKFALKAHPSIAAKVAGGIFDDVKSWNNDSGGVGTLKVWELMLDCWDAGLVLGSSGVEGVLRSVPRGDVPGLEKVLSDRLAAATEKPGGMTEDDVPF